LKFIVPLTLTLLGAVSATLAGEAEVARVKAELPAAARRLDKMFSQVRGKARVWHDNPRLPKQRPPSEAVFAIDHGMEKVEFGHAANSIYCIGEDTAFRLYRKTGARSYEVEGIGLELVDSAPMDRYRYIAAFGRYLRASHGMMGFTMSQILESPGFEIRGAEVIKRDGKALMRVDLAWGSRDPREEALVDFDPDAGWVVRSCHYRPGPTTFYDAEIEYGDSLHDGVPLPRHVRLDDFDLEVHHCEFTDWTFTPTPLSEFNMTHYGLPDMVKAHRRRNWLPYWFAGGAVAVCGVAFAFRRLASRGFSFSRR
jgi:hypothetical protein